VIRVGDEPLAQPDVGERMPEREVLCAPQGQEWQIAEEVTAGRNALGIGDGRQLIPDRRQARQRVAVVVAVGLRGVLVEAVREGLARERAEVQPWKSGASG
jgi:hypothetical protein